jgi:hypothetical protein
MHREHGKYVNSRTLLPSQQSIIHNIAEGVQKNGANTNRASMPCSTAFGETSQASALAAGATACSRASSFSSD